MTSETATVREIDVSKRSRALSFLRAADGVLIILLGPVFISLVLDLLLGEGTMEIATILPLSILGFGIYTAFLDVGTINPKLWRNYLLVLPLIRALSILASFAACASSSATDSVQTIMMATGVLFLALPAIFGLRAVTRLRRMQIDELGVPLAGLVNDIRAKRGNRVVRLMLANKKNLLLGGLFGVFGVALLFRTAIYARA